MTTSKVGGWSPISPLTPADVKAFEKIQQKLGVGVGYIPMTVQRQVVQGTNYRFQCIAIYPQKKVKVVEITAYIDLQGAVHHVIVTPLGASLPEFMGDWSIPEPVNQKDKALFERAVKQLDSRVGVRRIPLLVSRQLVNGTNYLYITRIEVVNASHTVIGYAPFTFHVALDGTISKLNLFDYRKMIDRFIDSKLPEINTQVQKAIVEGGYDPLEEVTEGEVTRKVMGFSVTIKYKVVDMQHLGTLDIDTLITDPDRDIEKVGSLVIKYPFVFQGKVKEDIHVHSHNTHRIFLLEITAKNRT